MKCTFRVWAADEVIQAYLDFIRKRNSKEVHVNYASNDNGFKETMRGKLEIGDRVLKQLPKRFQYSDATQALRLERKDISLFMTNDHVELIFEDSLKKPVFNHFKEFEPKTI